MAHRPSFVSRLSRPLLRLAVMSVGLSLILLSSVVSPPAAGAALAVKPPMQGILDSFRLPTAAWQPVVNGYVIPVRWADLQPTAGGPIVADNAIDKALAQIRQLNTQNPALGLTLKLRVLAGRGAPLWAKSLGGAPIEIYAPYDGVTSTIGRFWTSAFASAYQDLQNKLAAKYDGAPEIRDVVISRCMMTFAEPFVRDTSAKTIGNLLAAGFTYQADQACLTQQVDAHKVWSTTTSSLAFNPYQQINADGSVTYNETWTEQVMEYCRQSLGQRCTLANNSVRDPISVMGSKYASLYAKMKALGSPLAFQSAAPHRVGNLCNVLVWAIGQGADSVEAPADYAGNTTYSTTGMSAYDKRLGGGLAATGSASPTTPSSLKATTSGTTTGLSWAPSSDDMGVTCYTVVRNGVPIATTMNPRFTDSNLATNTNYTYTVTARDAEGNTSGTSAPATVFAADTTAPTTPAALTAVAASATQVNLRWTASTDDVAVTQYLVFRGGVQIGTSTSPSFSDTNARPATNYSYTVGASDAAGNISAKSNIATVTTPADTQAPAAPSGLAVIRIESDLRVSWQASWDNVAVVGYRVYRDGSQVATVTGTNFTDTNVKRGKTYRYTVRAYDAAGNVGAASDPVSSP